MADNASFFRDSKPPFQIADYPTITLLTTSLMLWPSGSSPSATPAGYWWAGKRMKITAFCRMTTTATAGALTFEIRLGTADNAGTIIATSAAVTPTSSKTNISWVWEAYVHARDAPKTAANMFAWGRIIPDNTGLLLAAAANPLLMPASAPAAVTFDTTAATAVNLQVKQAATTGATIIVHDLIVEALN